MNGGFREGKDFSVNVHYLSSGVLQYELKDHEKIIYKVIFTHDNSRLVNVSDNKTARLWDLSSGKLLNKIDLAYMPKPTTSCRFIIPLSVARSK